MTRKYFPLLTLLILPLLAQSPAFKPQQRRWWAIQPVAATAPPVIDQAGQPWARNEIDRFVYEKLKAKGLRPSAAASRQVYLRRVTLDLTGLPPTLAEAQNYLADDKPGAEDRLVDRRHSHRVEPFYSAFRHPPRRANALTVPVWQHRRHHRPMVRRPASPLAPTINSRAQIGRLPRRASQEMPRVIRRRKIQDHRC